MVRLLDSGVVRYQWVPGSVGLTTPAAPKVSDLNAGTTINLTPLLVAGSPPITVAASDTNDEKSMADTANGQTPTFDNYSGSLNLFRDFENDASPSDDDPYEIFPRKGIFGWVVRRIGPPQATAFAVGQKVDALLFVTDTPQASGDNTSGSLKLLVPLLPQGQMHLNRTLVT